MRAFCKYTNYDADISLGGTYPERKYALLISWGFTCKCSLCNAPKVEMEKSDQRRERIYEIHDILEQGELNTKVILALREEVEALVDVEQMWPQLVSIYEDITRAFMRIGDFTHAIEFAQLTDRSWTKYGGEFHEYLEGVQLLWEELEMRVMMAEQNFRVES
jgi:hypothetical protein